jgi:hypothetical protein
MSTEEIETIYAAQAARWADPQALLADFQARIPVAPPTVDQVLQRQRGAMRRAPKIAQKLYWLREMADTWGAPLAANAACRGGCSACCNQAVAVSENEARVIAEQSGAVLHTPDHWPSNQRAAAEPYIGVPCTFLKEDGKCSIYAARPISCRVHFNMDRDALLCQILPGKPMMSVPSPAATLVLQTSEDVLGGRQADIRQFFPNAP